MKKILSSSSKWKLILLEIYRHSPNGYIETHNSKFMDDKHPLAVKFKIKGLRLGYSIGFLRKNKLIGDTNPLEPLNEPAINPEWFNMIYLTEKGFNLALEIEKQIREMREKERFEKLQKWIVILTAILVLSNIINILF